MLEFLGHALVTWAKTGTQSLVERIFNSGIFETSDEDVVYLEGFPRTIQLDGHSCGVQVLRAVLAYYGKDVDAFGIHWEIEDEGGIDESTIRDVLGRFDLKGRASISGFGRLEKAINRNRPVIVSMDDEDHWAVVFGYSPSYIYLMDPSPRRLLGLQIEIETFKERWDYWGLEVRES